MYIVVNLERFVYWAVLVFGGKSRLAPMDRAKIPTMTPKDHKTGMWI